jgi:MFS family permease
VSRKALLVVGPLVQGAALAVVAVAVSTGHASIPLLAAAELVSGFSLGLRSGASTPALRRIVPKEQLADATARTLSRDMLAELIGAPLGGALFKVNRWFPFAADAVSFLFAAAGGAAIRRPLGPDRCEERRRVTDDIRLGLRFVTSQPYLRFMLLWCAAINVILYGFLILLIGIVRYRGGDSTTIGVVNSVALIGGIGGSVLAPAALRVMRARHVLYATAWGFAATVALVAIVPRIWEIAVVLFVATVSVAPLNVVLQAYEVRLVPDALSGRVSSTLGFGIGALQWAGPIVGGLLGGVFGVPHGLLILAALMVPVALALYLVPAVALLDRPVAEVEELPAPDRDNLQLAR